MHPVHENVVKLHWEGGSLPGRPSSIPARARTPEPKPDAPSMDRAGRRRARDQPREAKAEREREHSGRAAGHGEAEEGVRRKPPRELSSAQVPARAGVSPPAPAPARRAAPAGLPLNTES